MTATEPRVFHDVLVGVLEARVSEVVTLDVAGSGSVEGELAGVVRWPTPTPTVTILVNDLAGGGVVRVAASAIRAVHIW